MRFAIRAVLLASVTLSAADLRDRTVSVNGHAIHMRISAGGGALPAVVFESGLGDDSGSWTSLIALLPAGRTMVAYDRPGLGRSEPDGELPTAEHVANVLHSALSMVGVKAPYILVGHSWGGPRIQKFASMFPKEVAGLVMVDPTDFTLTRERELKAIFEPLGLGAQDRDAFYGFVNGIYELAPQNIRTEWSVAYAAVKSDYQEFSREPLQGLPVVVLLAGREGAPPGGAKPPVDMVKLAPQQVRASVASFTDWAARGNEVTVLLTPNSTHYIHRFEPELVREAIDRVTYPDVARRLERAFRSGGPEQMNADLSTIERSYPAGRYSGMVLDSYARAWLSNGAAPAARALLEIIAKRDPNEWQAHASLAQACLQMGDRECAMQSTKRILEIDPANAFAKQMIARLK